MEVYDTRVNIRRRLMAMVGMSPNASAVGPAMDQLNEAITQGNQETQQRRRWVRQLQSLRLNVGIDQRTIPFPANWCPGSIVSVAFWDVNSNLYIPLARRKIDLIRTSDPLTDPSSPSYNPTEELARQGMPVMYEPGPGNAISIWPPPDQQYELKFQSYPNPDLVNDTDLSVVDATCIVYWAGSCYLDAIQDTIWAQRLVAKFEQRVATLHAWQSTGQEIAIDVSATFDDNDMFYGLPRYDFETGRAPGV